MVFSLFISFSSSSLTMVIFFHSNARNEYTGKIALDTMKLEEFMKAANSLIKIKTKIPSLTSSLVNS